MNARPSLIACLLLSAILSSCAGQKQAVKEGAFEQGKIEVSTVGQPEAHQADIIIAILPFLNNSPDKSLDATGVTLADLISTKLASRKGFKIVERQRLQSLMGEMKLGYTGAVDQATAIQIGRILGANVMAFGSFSTISKKVILSLRLVKVETSEIVGGASERSDDISDLDVLAEKAAAKLADSLSGQ